MHEFSIHVFSIHQYSSVFISIHQYSCTHQYSSVVHHVLSIHVFTIHQYSCTHQHSSVVRHALSIHAFSIRGIRWLTLVHLVFSIHWYSSVFVYSSVLISDASCIQYPWHSMNVPGASCIRVPGGVPGGERDKCGSASPVLSKRGGTWVCLEMMLVL
jgi:hypothetical protein